MALFGLAVPRVRKTVSVYERGKPEIEWVVDPRLGTFPTAIAAMRSYVLAMEPGMERDVPDDMIRRQWRMHSTNLKQVKVVRV